MHPERVVEKVNAAAEITRAMFGELALSTKPESERPTPPPLATPLPKRGTQPTAPTKVVDDSVSYNIILVKHRDRPARLILTRRVSATGLGWIQYLDNHDAVEVVLTECVMDSLLEK